MGGTTNCHNHKYPETFFFFFPCFTFFRDTETTEGLKLLSNNFVMRFLLPHLHLFFLCLDKELEVLRFN